MPRKKKARRHTGRPAVAPWIVLAGSLMIIGFACTRTTQQTHAPRSVGHRIARATETPVPAPRPSHTPLAAPSTQPQAQAKATPQPRTRVANLTPAPAKTGVPAAAASREPAADGRPRLALIIDDCGQWLDTERAFIALPVPLTLSVLPNVRFNATIAREAAGANKGVMLHLPMETLSGLNPGPGKVTTEMRDDAIVAQVDHDLDDVDLARGVNNHEGSKATANERVMEDVMSVLARRHRFFIDSRTNGASVAERVASERGVATAGRDVFLDNRADVNYTEAQLRAAVVVAKRDGSAIAIGHPRPTTLVAVRAMIPELQADGITLVLAGELTH